MAEAELVAYLNGDYAPLAQQTVPIDTHALQYGTACFEGIRAYWNGERLSVLFLREHCQRLAASARMLLMQSPGVDAMCAIALEVLRRSGLRQNSYLRPVVFKKGTNLGPELSRVDDGYLCYPICLEGYFESSKGLSLCVSSWMRVPDNSIPTRAKATGCYINSALAKSEAVLNGFDESIMLNDRHQVSEGSAENVFIVRDGSLITPDYTAGILEGITRKAIIGLAQEQGVPVIERPISRTELYRADECFLVGTGCQVSWVRAIDHRSVGSGERGPLTRALQAAYEEAVYGRDPARAHWLTAV